MPLTRVSAITVSGRVLQHCLSSVRSLIRERSAQATDIPAISTHTGLLLFLPYVTSGRDKMMWDNTRMVVFTAICASLYAAILIPFNALLIIPGVSQLR